MPPSLTELCGETTKDGLPCTMPKGHYAPYHRHRKYKKVDWQIETTMGEVLEKGSARVPMNYAITRQLEKHDMLKITLRSHETGEQ